MVPDEPKGNYTIIYDVSGLHWMDVVCAVVFGVTVLCMLAVTATFAVALALGG